MTPPRFILHQLPAAIIFVLLSGCASVQTIPKPPPDFTPVEAIDGTKHEKLAVQFLDAHDYQRALRELMILQAIYPDHHEYRNRARVLRALIKRRANSATLSAKNEIKKGQMAKAEKSLRQALAIDPGQREALEILRALGSRKAMRMQHAKTDQLQRKRQATGEHDETEHATDGTQETFYLELARSLYQQGDWSGCARETGKYLTSRPNDPRARTLFVNAALKAAETHRNKQQLEAARTLLTQALPYSDANSIGLIRNQLDAIAEKLSEIYYLEGIKIYREDIRLAIAFWEKSLEADPDHSRALAHLDVAKQSLKNLQQIRQ